VTVQPASDPAAVKRIGIYGGSFDPVHIGHLRSAIEVRQQFALDQLLLIPSGQPPHRAGARASADHRLQMLELAVRGAEGLIVDPSEVQSQAVSYTIDTIERLQASYPDDRLVLVIGMDQFVVFETWHRWREILQRVELVVMERPGETFDQASRQRLDIPDALAINLFPVTQIDISSSRIRADLGQNREIRFLVPAAVRQHINDHRLYGELTD